MGAVWYNDMNAEAALSAIRDARRCRFDSGGGTFSNNNIL